MTELDQLKSQLEKEREARLKAEAACAEMRAALENLVNTQEELCWHDHHGYCQAHYLESPCSVAEAKKALSSPAGEKVLRVINAVKECLGCFDNDFGESVVGEALPELKQALAALEKTE